MSSVLELQSGGYNPAMGIFPANYGISGGVDASGDKEKPLIRLREPRDLYSTTSLQHPPKWPIECQVISDKIRHIETVPAKLEPFYVPTYSEPQPRPVGEEMGTVVYDYQPKLSVDYFCRSCVGGSDALEPFEAEPNALKFESRFESGNLARAIKITNVYYEIHLRQDLYTDRHSQWFYFRIQNMKENVMYRFSIVNFNKPDSLYRYGLKVLTYSEKEAQLNKVGWVRSGQNISYFKNDIPSSEDNGCLYTLTFNLKFKHSNDTVYLAHCYPYTYSQLQNYLRALEDDPFKSDLLTVRLLCRSLAGNNVYVVTITSPDNYNDENQKKPAIVLSARVHPGETQSSFMMKGIIDFLTSDSPQAKELRDRFIFKLIPMLNPDGVIVGNSRCCLLGQDLNRQYRTVLREAFPQIYQTKVLLRRLAETNGIFLYCDIHGHSRRNNVFIYGCENRKFPDKKLIEQVFPLMMHKNAADKFSFQNCKFRIQKTKEGTGRVFAWTLGVVNSYTLEISLGGSTMPSRPGTHFNTADYEAVGRHFCETLLDYSDPSPEKERLREKILQRLTDEGSNADEPVNINVTDYSSLSHSESDESDSETPKKSTEGSNPLKRQASLRQPKKKVKPNNPPPSVSSASGKIEPIQPRAVMNVSKTSVSTVRILRKISAQEEAQEEVDVQKEIAVFKRLTKFRRRVRRDESQSVVFQNVVTSTVEKQTVHATGPKCASILFDDPFNPPGTIGPRRQLQPRILITDEEAVSFDDIEASESGSGTEDECDEKDGAIKNRNLNFSQVTPENLLLGIVEESMGNLRLSHTRRNTISNLSPFSPAPRGTSGTGPNRLSPRLTLPKKKSMDDDSLQKRVKDVGVGQRRRASVGPVIPSSNSKPPIPSNQATNPIKIVKAKSTSKISSISSTTGQGQGQGQKDSGASVSKKRSKFKQSKAKRSH